MAIVFAVTPEKISAGPFSSKILPQIRRLFGSDGNCAAIPVDYLKRKSRVTIPLLASVVQNRRRREEDHLDPFKLRSQGLHILQYHPKEFIGIKRLNNDISKSGSVYFAFYFFWQTGR